MKSKKRIISGLCLAAVLCLSGCGNSESSDTATISSVVTDNVNKTADEGAAETKDGKTVEASSKASAVPCDTQNIQNNSEIKDDDTSSDSSVRSENTDKTELKDSSIDSDKDEELTLKDTKSGNNSKGFNASEYVGTWSEEYSHRGKIVISSANDGTYKIDVTWGGSAFVQGLYSMTAVYDTDTQYLYYSNATYTIRTYSDESTYIEETQYSDGTGFFYIDENKLGWLSDNSDIDNIDGSYFYTRGLGEADETSDNSDKSDKTDKTDENNNIDSDSESNPDDENDEYLGCYVCQDFENGSAELIITKDESDESIYQVVINIPNPDEKYETINFSGKFDGRGSMNYSDAVRTCGSYDDTDELITTDIYTDGNGFLTFSYPDGDNVSITWHDNITGTDTTFLKPY